MRSNLMTSPNKGQTVSEMRETLFPETDGKLKDERRRYARYIQMEPSMAEHGGQTISINEMTWIRLEQAGPGLS
jgi:hypothetical protein